jgi:hypothetical protein
LYLIVDKDISANRNIRERDTAIDGSLWTIFIIIKTRREHILNYVIILLVNFLYKLKKLVNKNTLHYTHRSEEFIGENKLKI